MEKFKITIPKMALVKTSLSTHYSNSHHLQFMFNVYALVKAGDKLKLHRRFLLHTDNAKEIGQQRVALAVERSHLLGMQAGICNLVEFGFHVDAIAPTLQQLVGEVQL